MLGINLSLTGQLLNSIRDFTPVSLFALSEPGIWYDPSDLNTLFQDAAGTTPVTAAGQPVGLLLDKSKGLVLGPELVTNGDFSAGSTGWTTGSAITSSIVSGEAQVTFGGSSAITANNWFSQAGILAGTSAFYKVTFDATWVSGGVLQVSSGFDLQTTISANAGKTSYSVIVKRGTSGAATDQQALVFSGAAGAVWKIDNISVRELAGNHATQSTAASRPTYQIDGFGRPYLSFDGVDDFLVTPTITPGTDKVQVFVGVRRLSDAAVGVLLETSANFSVNNGTVVIQAPNAALSRYSFNSKGTAASNVISTATTAPTTNVLVGIGDIAADTSIMRMDGTQVASGVVDQGTGNYLAYPAYIGRRGGASSPYNGRVYGVILRFGANLDAATISATETWMNTKTGAY